MGRRRRCDQTAPWHHVYNRGARRLAIFGDDRDRLRFLQLLDDACEDDQVLAYALMGNHYHLVMRATSAELGPVMKSVAENFTRWFNVKYGYDGPLFRSRYGSKPITTESYLRHVIRYVHANPVKDGLGDWSYPWSGHPALLDQERPPRWLDADTIAIFGGREAYREFVESTPAASGNVATREAAAVKVATPKAVEVALGIDSRAELEVVVRGGRGLRNDLRAAAALLGAEQTSWSSPRLAARYGYSSGSSFRVAVKRARERTTSDPDFGALVDHARSRLVTVVLGGQMERVSDTSWNGTWE